MPIGRMMMSVRMFMAMMMVVVRMIVVVGLKLCMMVMNIDFTVSQTLFKILHESNCLLWPGNGFFNAFDKGINDVCLIA